MACIILMTVPPLHLKKLQCPEEVQCTGGKFGEQYRAFISMMGCTDDPWHRHSILALFLPGTPWEGRACEAEGGCTALVPTMPCTPL